MKRLGKIIQRASSYSLPIPFRGKVDVSLDKGQLVKPGDLLFKRSLKKIKRSYYLPKELGVTADRADDHVARLNGEYVTAGEILAERLAGGGLIVRKVHASVDGIISLQRLNKGYIDILAESETLEVTSDFRGTVEKIDMGQGMYVTTSIWMMRTTALMKPSKDEFDSIYAGKFEQIGDGSSIYVVKDLKDSYEGKIVFAGRFVYPDLVRELYNRGAELVVAYAMDYDDYMLLADPVILLGGFGNLGYDSYWQKSISAMFGSFCVVDIAKGAVMWADTGQFMNQNPYEAESIVVPVLKSGMDVMCMDVEDTNRVGKIAEMTDEGFVTVEFADGQRKLLSQDVLVPIHA
jgi:hypothetical protein